MRKSDWGVRKDRMREEMPGKRVRREKICKALNTVFRNRHRAEVTKTAYPHSPSLFCSLK